MLDGSYSFLEQRHSLLAFAEKCMNENMFLDPVNNTWHACPKTKKQAISGPDAERWTASMEKELDTIEKMSVWKETSYLPKGEFPLPCKFVHTQTFERRMYIGMEVSPLCAWKLIERRNSL